MQKPSLTKLLSKTQTRLDLDFDQAEKDLQHQLLRIQQGLWHGKGRAIILFEGFDAAGKGGCIRRLTENWDPRGFQVHPISAPDSHEQSKHYLYRFWKKLPAAGTVAVFDRSWYGRVLVEKVEKLAPKNRLQDAYKEINQFEDLLIKDGVHIIKIFLGISKKEQLQRYEDRLEDPYKQWKLTPDDLRNRGKWSNYVKATDLMFQKTSTRESPWFLAPADHKPSARHQVFRHVCKRLSSYRDWMDSKAAKWHRMSLKEALEKAK